MDACVASDAQVIMSEPVWDGFECQTKTITQTNFLLPSTMTAATTTNVESLTSASNDLCCQAFGNGFETM